MARPLRKYRTQRSISGQCVMSGPMDLSGPMDKSGQGHDYELRMGIPLRTGGACESLRYPNIAGAPSTPIRASGNIAGKAIRR